MTLINVYTIPAAMGLGIPVIVSERNNPETSPKSERIRKQRDLLYPKADGFVFQTPDAQKYFEHILPPEKMRAVIPNPLSHDLPHHVKTPGNRRLIAASRLLNEQKNLTLMIDAVGDVLEKGIECNLDIFGVGPDEEMLRDYIRARGLEGKIELRGFSHEIHREMADSAAFLISSNYEGLSNSMLEALAIGTPVIATDCPPGGARMFIEDGVNGLLVPVGDRARLAEAIERVLTDAEAAEAMGERAVAIREELNVEKITTQWLEFIECVRG